MDAYVCVTALVAAALARVPTNQSTKKTHFRARNRQPQWKIKTHLPAKYVDTGKSLRTLLLRRIGYYGYRDFSRTSVSKVATRCARRRMASMIL